VPLESRVVEDSDDIQVTLRYVPIGVVGGILPWNMPLVLGANKIGAALITGNCIILKPSPYTPYSVTKFTELVRSVFPAGVIQALNGDDFIGPAMCKHPGIGKISFTGSTATGKKIMSSASTTLKRVTLELGGNSASIICSDVDVKLVAPQLALGSFFNAGQLCVASKRIFVHKDIYKEFMHAFTEHVKGWKTGPMSSTNADASVMMGPVQNAMQYNIVSKIFRDSQEKGHTFALGGFIGEGQSLVIAPTIVDNPPDDSMVVEMEAFGNNPPPLMTDR
jgi:acyl-CoA reductase-like NAD-dependent aldehyde dehydrogenase